MQRKTQGWFLMQDMPPRPISTETKDFQPDARHTSPSFEGLLNRILSLALRLQNIETLSGKANLFCNELARLLARRTLAFLAFDEQYGLLASSLFSQNEKDYLAFERHLADAPASKAKFYTHLATLCCESPHSLALVENHDLFELLKIRGIDVHAPIEVRRKELGLTYSPSTIAHHLFETPTLKENLGAYVVVRSKQAKVNAVLYLGGGTEKICNSKSETEALLHTLVFIAKQTATLLENDEARRKAFQEADTLRHINQLIFKLVANSRAIKGEKDIRKKLALLCQNIAKPEFFDAAVAILLDRHGNISQIGAAGAFLQAPSEVDKALTPLNAVGKLPANYWQKLTQFAEKVSDTFVMLNAVIKDEDSPLSFPALCNAFTLLGHRQNEMSVTFFTPFVNQDGEIFGFTAYSAHAIPTMVEEWLSAVEMLIKAIENDLETQFRTTLLSELERQYELAKQKLRDSLNFSKSLSGGATQRERIETTLKAISQITNGKKVSAFLFDEHGDYAHGFECEALSVVEIPKPDLSKKTITALLPDRFALETILSCKGFELNGNFCFTPSQVERVMEGILTGGSIPEAFLSPKLLEENLQQFATASSALLLTPICYDNQVFGYLAYEPFRTASQATHLTDCYSESFSLMAFFARELGHELSIETLKETYRQSVQQLELTRDLTDALLESAKQFQTSLSVEEKAHSIAEALTEKFGFQFASIVFYEDGNTISISAYRAHSQAVIPNLEKRFSQRFQKGRRVPSNILDAIFRDEFKVGLFYVYRISDVRRVYRARQSGQPLPDNFGPNLLKDYASGDEQVTILIPLFDTHRKRIGHVALGQVMLSNLGADLLSLHERMKFVLVLVEHLALAMRSYLTAREKEIANENLRRSEARYRNLVENVSYGCIIFDAEGNIQFVNTALKGMLGYTMEAMRNKKLEQFAAARSLAHAKAMHEQVYSRQMQADAELFLVANTGDEIPFQVFSMPQLIVGKTGELELEGAFAVLTDLRPQYEIEKKKRQLETIKNNFYAMVVHDMKVPLAAIYGYSEMMKDAIPSQMNPAHFQDIMTQIHRSSINITNLIQEILEFSKYESHAVTLDLHLNDLAICAEMVIEQSQFGLNEKELQVITEFEPVEKFYFDFTRIARVISNLMSNAIKFSRRQSQIIVSIKKVTQHSKALAQCSVKDFGEGIPPSELENIFDAYRQAQSKHGSRGTGLGLSIAKQIVELHGGTIWAESTLGEGATLTFTLPIRTTLDRNPQSA